MRRASQKNRRLPGRIGVAVALIATAWLLAACRLDAQSNLSSASGTVVDPQGKAVSHAEVAVHNTDLNTRRSVLSGQDGSFRISGLAPGAYELGVKAGGLLLRRPVRFTVALGSSTQLTVHLDIAESQQHVTVHGRANLQEGNTVAPAVNRTEPAESDFFAGMTVTYLPNRDRDFTQFSALGAGMHEDPEGASVVSGQRSSAVVTQVDGTEFDNPLFGTRRGAEDGAFFLPQTVVREFEIVRSGVSADVGGTNAGLINVATKEGSNKLHGEAFYTGRPSAFTSSDSFGHSLDALQNTFGGSIGGPLRRNRSFFYAGIEKDFLHAPYFAQFEPQFPGSAVPDDLSAEQGPVNETNSPTAGFLRLDLLLNSANTLNLQASGNRIRATNIGDGLTRSIATADYASSLSGQSFWTRAGLTSVLTADAVSQLVLAWSSDHRNSTPNSAAPTFFINGFGTLGGNSLGRHLDSAERTELSETLLLQRRASSLTFGAGFSDEPVYEQREENLNGRFDYNSLDDYVAHAPRRFQQTFAVGDTRFSGSIRTLSFHANAKFPLTRRVTATAGLRWDGQWNPQPQHPNPQIQQTQRAPNDLAAWQPRLGLAWNPSRTTLVRLSSGIYSAFTPATMLHRAFIDNGLQTLVADSYFDPELLALTGATGSAPHALDAPPSALAQPHALVVGVDPNFRNPTSAQAAVSLNQQLLPKLGLDVEYLHSSTWHLQRRLDENLAPPSANLDGLPIFPAARPDPLVGRLLVNQSSAHSSYNGFLLTASSQISRRSQLLASYTYARTVDDDSNLGPYSIDAAVNPYDLRQEQANSSLDIRHVLNLSAILNLPLGFKLNPLLIAHSGAPFTPIIGFDTQNDANDWNDRALINGQMAARNSLRQPAFSDLDLRIVKDFTLKGEGHHLDLFMDVFNLAGAGNRTFGPQAVSLYGLPQSPVFTAGEPLFAPGSTRIGGPRAIQFTARLVAF